MALLKFSFDRFSFEKSTREKLNTKQSISSSQFLSNSFLSSNAFFGSFGSKEIIVESKMNSALADHQNPDQNYFQNTPIMNRISTQKNQGFKSTATQFLKKHFFGIVMVALCSVSTVFGQVPTITSFSPTSGAVGSTVTISGTNFDATASNNVVYFGSTKAVVNTASTTELSVSVPASSTHSPISVISNNKIAQSISAFRTVNLPISGRPINGNWFGNNILFSSLGGSVNNDVIIAAGDFNSDGKVDIVKAGNGSVRVHLNNMNTNGTITTSSLSNGTDFTVYGTINSIVVGDINADGMLDIVTGSNNGGSVLINTTSGGVLSFATAIYLNNNFYTVRVADFNGDGSLDIASLNFNGVYIYSNTISNGSVSFSLINNIGFSGYEGMDVGDMNADGNYDIVVTKGGQTAILVNTSYGGATTFQTSFTLAYGNNKVVVVDLDADGDNDLFVRTKLVANNYQVGGGFSASSFTDFAKPFNIDHDLGFSIADFNTIDTALI